MNEPSQIFRRDESRRKGLKVSGEARSVLAGIAGLVLMIFGGASVSLGVLVLVLIGGWSGFEEGIAGMIALSITVPGFLMLLTGFLVRRFAARRRRERSEDGT
ncbi:MAG: hypothetical protein AAF441_08245 [Pseudomonadota bacterium]